jgi:hypothetical protein
MHVKQFVVVVMHVAQLESHLIQTELTETYPEGQLDIQLVL